MLAEISICPVGSEHMSEDVAQVIETLKSTGLEYRLGPMSTCIQGDSQDVFTAIRRCHELVANKHERVLTTIVLDDRKHGAHELNSMVECVEKRVDRAKVAT